MTGHEQESLWPVDEIDTEIEGRSPTAILKEQAALVTQISSGYLQGRVKRTSHMGLQTVYLQLYSPALDYAHNLLQVSWDIPTTYPCDVFAFEEERQQANDEEEFKAILATILQSEAAIAVVNSLLAQSKEATEEAPL